MKKVIVCLVAILTLFLLAGLTSVHAYPYQEVEGFVNPTSATTIIDNGTTTTFSEVSYLFNVTYADFGAEMDSLSLEFEKDVFAGFGAISFDMPGDWSYSVLSPPTSWYMLANAGTTVGMGDQLRFTVSDVVVYNDALAGNALWQEGQIWAQSWVSGDDLGGNDGGSTALVPEPGTLMLFGAGLAGLFYVRRSKVFNI